jgi:hypothetical protein
MTQFIGAQVPKTITEVINLAHLSPYNFGSPEISTDFKQLTTSNQDRTGLA